MEKGRESEKLKCDAFSLLSSFLVLENNNIFSEAKLVRCTQNSHVLSGWVWGAKEKLAEGRFVSFRPFLSQSKIQCRTRCRHSSSSTRLTRKWSYYLEHAWIGFAQLNHVDMWKNTKILWPTRLERCASMNTISKYLQHERNVGISCSSFSNAKRMFYFVWRKFPETDWTSNA